LLRGWCRRCELLVQAQDGVARGQFDGGEERHGESCGKRCQQRHSRRRGGRRLRGGRAALPCHRVAWRRQPAAGCARDFNGPQGFPHDRCRPDAQGVNNAPNFRRRRFVSFPDSPFQLFQPYPPAGDQPRPSPAGRRRARRPGFQTLLGVTGSGKTFTMANVIARLGRPAIVFAPNKTLAAQLYSEFREFFPRTRSSTSSATTTTTSPRPTCRSATCSSRRTASINEHIEQMRLSATKSVLERRDTVIVATVSAIYGIGKPEDYTQMRFIVRVGDKHRPARRDRAADPHAVQPQRHRLQRAAASACAATPSTSFRPSTASWRCASSCSTTRSRACQLLDPLTGRVRQKIPRFVIYPSPATT
jgi:excinuclease ABC subunit B